MLKQALAILAFALIACGGSEDSQSPTTSPAPEAGKAQPTQAQVEKFREKQHQAVLQKFRWDDSRGPTRDKATDEAECTAMAGDPKGASQAEQLQIVKQFFDCMTGKGWVLDQG